MTSGWSESTKVSCEVKGSPTRFKACYAGLEQIIYTGSSIVILRRKPRLQRRVLGMFGAPGSDQFL